MLRQMRESMKTVLWIVVATFVISIFAIWGMDLRTPQRRVRDRNVVGLVGKESISQQAYQEMINQLTATIKQQKGENYTPSDMERRLIDDQAWEATIENTLVQNQMRKLGLTTVSDPELVSFLRKNPHPQLQEVFKTAEGKFDYQAYLKALSDPNVDWSELERWGRAMIPRVKLQTYLFAEVQIPERDALDRFRDENVQYKAEYIEVPSPGTTKPYEPTDAEIKALYDKRIADFMEPAMRRVSVIEIEKKPSVADEREVRDHLEALRQDILSGKTDFATAAKDNSDDQATAEKGGDLGFIKRGEMPSAFDSVAFSLKPGEPSEPVRTPSGYELVQVVERKKEGGVEEVHARHILVRVEPGYETTDSLQTEARTIAEAIHKVGFEKAAQDLHLKIFQTAPFAQGMFVKDLGYVPRIVSFAFNYKVGDVSSAIETESSYYFVKITEALPERVKPLDEVRPQLIAQIRSDRSRDEATATAESIRKAILSGADFAAAAKAHGYAAKETPLFKLNDAIPGIGTNTAFSVACRYLQTGAVSPPIAGEGRVFIIKLLQKTEPDMAKYADERAKIMDDLRNELASRFVSEWYQGVREKAQVVDLREKTLD
jgi:peptidyl-prolyl cis-trans isomerase D